MSFGGQICKKASAVVATFAQMPFFHVNIDPQSVQYIRRTATTGKSAITVLGHRHATGRDNNGRHGRYIKCIFMISTGPDDVQNNIMLGLDRHYEFPHDHSTGGDLFDRRPFFIKGQ